MPGCGLNITSSDGDRLSKFSIDILTDNRRCEPAKLKTATNTKLVYAEDLATKKYGEQIALLHVRPHPAPNNGMQFA